MPQLCANSSDARAPVNQRRGNAVPERMKARERNSYIDHYGRIS